MCISSQETYGWQISCSFQFGFDVWKYYLSLLYHRDLEFRYYVKPWVGGDKVRPDWNSNIFLDLFVIREYQNLSELKDVIGVKANGQWQPQEYVESIISKMQGAAFSQSEFNAMFPLWHFNTRKAIEMWTKERPRELLPFDKTLLCFGPMTGGIQCPRMQVLLLKRAFGSNYFEVYYQSVSHHTHKNKEKHIIQNRRILKQLLQNGSTWEDGRKMQLEDQHYLPIRGLRGDIQYTIGSNN